MTWSIKKSRSPDRGEIHSENSPLLLNNILFVFFNILFSLSTASRAWRPIFPREAVKQISNDSQQSSNQSE